MIIDYKSGWLNTETGEIGDYKNGKPVKKPFWQRWCGRNKIDLFAEEFIGIVNVRIRRLWTTVDDVASFCRIYNKFTNETKSVYVTCRGRRIYCDPNAWEKQRELVKL